MVYRRNSTFTRRDSGEYVRDDGKAILVFNFNLWKTFAKTQTSILFSKPMKKLFVWTFQGFIEICVSGATMTPNTTTINEGTTPIQGIFDVDHLPEKNQEIKQ